MSALLNSLLDAARQSACALHDAQLSHSQFSFYPQEVPVKLSIPYERHIERTEKDGRRTYPTPLRREATPEAQRGWTRAALDAFRAYRLAPMTAQATAR